MIADKGYHADAIVRHIEANGAKPGIPPKCNRCVKRKFSILFSIVWLILHHRLLKEKIHLYFLQVQELAEKGNRHQ